MIKNHLFKKVFRSFPHPYQTIGGLFYFETIEELFNTDYFKGLLIGNQKGMFRRLYLGGNTIKVDYVSIDKKDMPQVETFDAGFIPEDLIDEVNKYITINFITVNVMKDCK